MSDVKTAIVAQLPDCDFCKMEGKKEPAEYDARIPRAGGRWGNLCQLHFDQQGCSLGLGRGQKLVLETPEPQTRKDEADKLCERCGKGCPDDCWNKSTGRYRILDSPEKIEVMIMMGLYCEEI